MEIDKPFEYDAIFLMSLNNQGDEYDRDAAFTH